MPNLLEKLLKPKRNRYKPPPIPRPLFIVSFHEFIKWFKQLEPGRQVVTNGVVTLYTCPPGRIAFIDHINIHADNVVAAGGHVWVVIRNSAGTGLRFYMTVARGNDLSTQQFTIPSPGDYLKEGDYVELYSPNANIESDASFHGWEGTRVK